MTVTVLFIALAILQIPDTYTTYVIVHRQGGRERNPVMRWLIRQLGVLPGLIAGKALAVSLAGYALYAGVPLLPYWGFFVVLGLLAALIGLYAWVVYNNYQIIYNSLDTGF